MGLCGNVIKTFSTVDNSATAGDVGYNDTGSVQVKEIPLWHTCLKESTMRPHSMNIHEKPSNLKIHKKISLKSAWS